MKFMKLNNIIDNYIMFTSKEKANEILHSGYFAICKLWAKISKYKNNYYVKYFIDALNFKALEIK